MNVTCIAGEDFQNFLFGPFQEPVTCLDYVCNPVMALDLIADIIFDADETAETITNLAEEINEFLFRYIGDYYYHDSICILIAILITHNINFDLHESIRVGWQPSACHQPHVLHNEKSLNMSGWGDGWVPVQ